MAGRKLLTIVNPRGGLQQGASVLDTVRPILEAAEIALEVHKTERAGHATDIVKESQLADFDGLCVIGGDGTAHEAVRGLMLQDSESRIPIGLIPAGTGNTLHHELGCETPTAAAEHIVAGKTRPIDVACVTTDQEEYYCINIVGWGAVVDINVTAERLRKLGRSRYALAALWNVLWPRPRRATLTLDGHQIEDEFLFIIGCNTRSTGSKMLLAPQAKIGDGLIDLVVLRNTSRRQMLNVFRKAFDGSHLSLPCIECHQVRSFSLTSDRPELLNLDGELEGKSPLSVEVRSDAICVFG